MNNLTQKNETSLEMQKRLLEYSGQDKMIDWEDLIAEAQKNPPLFFKTDFKKFDNLLGGGIEETDFGIITGNSNNGKTTLGIALCASLSRQNIMCSYFSFEMGNIQVIRRFPHFPKTAHLLCMPTQYEHKNLNWLEDRIVEAKIKFNSKIIFIDNLDFIVPLLFSQNIESCTRSCAKILKELTIKHNIAIILMAHTRKNSGEVELQDIKDSKTVGDLSDWAIVCTLIDREQGKANVKFIKNRHELGRMGSVYTFHNFQTRETSEMNEEETKAIESKQENLNLKDVKF